MTARLFCKWGALRGADYRIGAEATIGRAGDNTVPIDDRSVSSRHARIVFDKESDAYYLEDLGSLNGTRVDGVAVSGRERLDRLHLLAFGVGCEFVFVRLEAEAGGEPADSEPTEELPPAAPGGTQVDREMPPLPVELRAPGEPGKTMIEELAVPLPRELVQAPAAGLLLEIPLPDGGVKRLELGEGEHVIGRGGNADVVLDSSDVSRRHAVLSIAGGAARLRDLESRNHTYVGEARIEGEVELELPARLRFASYEARLVRAGGEAPGGGERR